MSRTDELANCTLLGVFPDSWIGILFDMADSIVARARKERGIKPVHRKLPAVVDPGTEHAFFVLNDDAKVLERWKSHGISKPAIAALRAYLAGRRKFVVADAAFMHELATVPLEKVALKYGLHVSYLMPLRAKVVPKNTFLHKSLRRTLNYLRGKSAGFVFSPADLAFIVFHDVNEPLSVANRTVKRLVTCGYAEAIGNGSYAWKPFYGVPDAADAG